MKKFLLVILIVSAIAGCQSTVGLLTGANRTYHFTSKEEMAAHFNKKNKIDTERLYFFDDTDDYNAFVSKELQGKMTGTFYAVAVNDSLRIPEDPAADMSCVGVTATFVTTAATDPITVEGLHVPHGLKDKKLSTTSGRPLDLNTGQPTVIFVVHSVMGRIINSNSGYILKQMKKERPDLNYVYIALDQPVRVTQS